MNWLPDAACAATWLASSRGAYAILTWYGRPTWESRACGLPETFAHKHKSACYKLNLPASRRLRTATAVAFGPAVLAGMAAWCWVYGLAAAAAWLVTAGQPRSRAETAAAEAEAEAEAEAALAAAEAEAEAAVEAATEAEQARRLAIEDATVTRALTAQTGRRPHYAACGGNGTGTEIEVYPWDEEEDL